jgi:cytochrome bd-type quinol oxidase subunit 2
MKRFSDLSTREKLPAEERHSGRVPEMRNSLEADPQLLRALAGLDADADMAVVQRTRRAVMAATHEMHALQIKRRRQVGIVLLVTAALVILLTPAIWSVVDDLSGGEHFFDAPTLTMSLIATLISTIFAALIVRWRSGQSHNGEKF